MERGLFDLTESEAQVLRAGSASPTESRLGLNALVEDSRRADEFVRQGVKAARAAGHSWKAIGYALGVSAQAVWQRYSDQQKGTG